MKPTSRKKGRMQVRHTAWRSRHSNDVDLTIRTASQLLDPNRGQQQPRGNQRLCQQMIRKSSLDQDITYAKYETIDDEIPSASSGMEHSEQARTQLIIRKSIMFLIFTFRPHYRPVPIAHRSHPRWLPLRSLLFHGLPCNQLERISRQCLHLTVGIDIWCHSQEESHIETRESLFLLRPTTRGMSSSFQIVRKNGDQGLGREICTNWQSFTMPGGTI